jgi:Flp pilus assembly protein TadG
MRTSDLLRFARNVGGTAATEFALVLPFLVAVMLGSMEIHRYMRHLRHFENALDTLAQITSQRSSDVTGANLAADAESIQWVFPEIYQLFGAGWKSRLGIQITSVEFTGCTTTKVCTTTNVKWVWRPTATPLPPSLQRSCNALTSSNSTQLTGASLNASFFGPGSLIIVDLSYAYTPFLNSNLIPVRTIVRQAAYAPRYTRSFLGAATSDMNLTKCY